MSPKMKTTSIMKMTQKMRRIIPYCSALVGRNRQYPKHILQHFHPGCPAGHCTVRGDIYFDISNGANIWGFEAYCCNCVQIMGKIQNKILMVQNSREIFCIDFVGLSGSHCIQRGGGCQKKWKKSKGEGGISAKNQKAQNWNFWLLYWGGGSGFSGISQIKM